MRFVRTSIIKVTLWLIAQCNGHTGCRFDGVNTRINAVSNQTGQGSPAGGSNTGIVLTAINTAAYD
ncbi:hypothetical protein FR762_19175 [Enterobacter sp. E76]|nr:hypothetical protein FR762_19175 [Enterobacter sp. E76]